jgi:Skp family chaperone for outer membrane proteins
LSVISNEENRIVKRKWIIATAGVAATAALVYVGTLWAQQPGTGPSVPARPAAAPRTKIALLNLTYVISYYEKYKAYKEDMKKQAQPYEDKIKAKQSEIEGLRKEGVDSKTTEARRQEIENLIRHAQHDIDDANGEAKVKLAKEAQDQMVLLYQEVQKAASKYAAAHDFDLVLQYNEPLDPKDYYSATNVERKMGAGALIPLYYSSGMEISQDVLTMLNASYHPAAAAPASGAPPAPTP